MNFNLVEIYNGLLRFNKHILNELAEGLKHLPNLEGASKGDSLYINEAGNPTWGSSAFIPTFENAAYGIEWTKNDNDVIRIGNAKFHRELPIQNRLKGCVYNEKKISYFLNPIHKLNHFPINFKITRYDWRIYTKCRKEKVKS